MSEVRRQYEPEFREGAVRIVRETGKSIGSIAEQPHALIWHHGQVVFPVWSAQPP